MGEVDEGRPTPTRADLFLGFAAVSALAFGGVLPWARHVLVEKRRWLSPAEFTDMLALCQLLPGPNIVNMSVAVGARFGGPAGSLAAAAGLLVLPMAIVLVLAGAYARVSSHPVAIGALAGMAAAAAGLILGMTARIGAPVLREHPWSAVPIVAAVFAAVALLRWPLWPVLLAAVPAAVALAWRLRR
jgi:chromate transporter